MVGTDAATRERIGCDGEIEIDDFARPDSDFALTGNRGWPACRGFGMKFSVSQLKSA